MGKQSDSDMCYIYKWNPSGNCMVSLAEGFPFLRETGHIVSLAGAGGKTSLMYALAREGAASGMRVLVMTSTHIRKPEQYYAGNERNVQELWQAGKYAVIGREERLSGESGQVKLSMPDFALYASLREQAELVLIEADGAKEYSCKVPRDHEPVLLPESDIVIGVAGMGVIGRTIKESCFCPNLVSEFLGRPLTAFLRAEDLVSILLSQRGTRKNVGERAYYIFLNQCDREEQRRQAGEMAEAILDRGEDTVREVLYGSLKY